MRSGSARHTRQDRSDQRAEIFEAIAQRRQHHLEAGWESDRLRPTSGVRLLRWLRRMFALPRSRTWSRRTPARSPRARALEPQRTLRQVPVWRLHIAARHRNGRRTRRGMPSRAHQRI